MIECLMSFLLVAGGFFMLMASIGLLKFPDLFTRMQAVTKASSLALSLILLAAVFYFRTTAITVRAFATIFFVFATASIGAHVIARVAYTLKVPLWEKTLVDEFQEAQKKPSTQKVEEAPKKNTDSRVSNLFRNLKKYKFD